MLRPNASLEFAGMQDATYALAMNTNGFIISITSMILVTMFAITCGGGRSKVSLSPTVPPSIAPAVPSVATSTATASVPLSGIAEVDQVVKATLAGDVDALVRMLHYKRLGCVTLQQVGSPPACRAGEAVGTMVDGFVVGGCDGTYERADEIPPRVASVLRMAERSLYAVFRLASGGADYRVLFVYTNAQRLGLAVDLKDGGIVEMNMTCGTVEMATKGVMDFIVAPAAGAAP